jgi:hypothetical protein
VENPSGVLPTSYTIFFSCSLGKAKVKVRKQSSSSIESGAAEPAEPTHTRILSPLVHVISRLVTSLWLGPV